MADDYGYTAVCCIPNFSREMLEGANSGYFGVLGMPADSSSDMVVGLFTTLASFFVILFTTVVKIMEPIPSYPGDDPNKSPGDDWKWKGTGSPSDGKGNYTNPNTGESLHPDLNHPKPIGPHWDYKDPLGKWWRLFPDGGISVK